jgi:DNA invertase Pin-like site-specific DNA recombinase
MSLPGYRLQGQPQQKIRPEHLDRAAVVYVRQSGRQQVLEHSESTRLQYALAERAVALGWARSQVMVIDDDLGVSAATAGSRKGFARLVTEVTMGRAGVVLGIEMSRLARTGRDWHLLLELCCLSGVLLADPGGVYDPGAGNDRLLLGLKGTMSEHELYLIRQRMLSGKLAKAERGELAVPLPIGYVRRPSGEVILDPDGQARHVVRLVFAAFARLGTLNGVLRYLAGQQVQLPVRLHSGPAKGEIEWRRPTRETLQIMLHNPVYAGYYAYGRRQAGPRRTVPGRPGTGRVVKEASAWLVLLPGRMPAYITPEQYEANVARMAASRQTAATPGAPRDGTALLSGLLRCGRCGGHRMVVRYHDSTAAARSVHGYVCAFYQVNYGTGGRCQHISGPALDAYVAGQVLQAVAPAGLEVSLAAAAQAEDERAMLDKLWRQRLERGRYAAGRARRQFQLAEPENRLVARQLRSPRRPGWRRTTSGSPRNSPRPSAQQNARRSRPWLLISPTSGALRRPARPTARNCCASSSRTSPSRPAGTASWPASPSPGPAGTRPRGRPSARSAAWTSCRTTPRCSPASPGSPPRAAPASRSPTPSTPGDSGRPSGPAGSPASRSAP